jgi:signal transduction histidine kinase
VRTAELQAANEELKSFTYSVSHDLRAPLRGIDGYSQLLVANYADRLGAEGRRLLGNVRQGAQQMGRLIEDLLAYSRIERRGLSGARLNLATHWTRVVKERQDEIAARGVVIGAALDGLTAQADPEGLTIVLRNLLDNALKFTRDSQPPRIHVRGKAEARSVVLAIEDNGIGFDLQFKDRIFEIFQRLQRAEDYPGTGIGLAIVRKAMQRMGGRVWADGAVGKGATFFLELPQ